MPSHQHSMEALTGQRTFDNLKPRHTQITGWIKRKQFDSFCKADPLEAVSPDSQKTYAEFMKALELLCSIKYLRDVYCVLHSVHSKAIAFREKSSRV